MKKKRLKNLYNIITILVFLGLIGVVSIFGYGTYYIIKVIEPQTPTPKIEDILEPLNKSATIIKDRFGNTVEEVKLNGNQIILSSDEIPKNVKNAFVSIEDKRFYNHPGIDTIRIAGAMLKNIKERRVVQGASTITQQLAGMTYLDRSEKSIDRKLKEAVIAWKMSNRIPKDEILTAYINNIYYGVGKSGKICYGIEAAANDFFGKHASQLTLGESALLAGIVNNPTQTSPITNPKGSKERRDTVLYTMKENKYITDKEYEKALKESIKVKTIVKPSKNLLKENYYYIDEVVLQAMDILGIKEIKDFYNSGVTVNTFLDQPKQRFLYNYLNNDNTFPIADRTALQASAVLKNNVNGSVIAMIGGRKTGDTRFGFNRAAMGYRQPGSAIKPIAVYAPAFALGKFDTGSIVKDEEIELETSNGPHKIRNADGLYHGDVTIRQAIVNSYNPVAVKVLESSGISNSLQFTKIMGLKNLVIETGEPRNDVNLTTALGGITKGTTVSEMATSYSVFPNKGIKKDAGLIRSIVDKSGKEVYSYTENKDQEVLSNDVCYMISSTLKDVVDYGTGVSARQIDGRPFYGKTGTTDDFKDIWFAGYTTDYSVAVWIGYDTPRPIQGNSLLAAELAGTIIYNTSQGLPIKTIQKPDTVKTYITRTGKVELYSVVNNKDRMNELLEENREKERQKREQEEVIREKVEEKEPSEDEVFPDNPINEENNPTPTENPTDTGLPPDINILEN